MTFEEFENSLHDTSPPDGFNEILLGLWYDGRGDWESAHNIAQSKEGVKQYDRLHAYLHRVEGDRWNAGYWYKRAGASMPDVSLKEEWDALVQSLL